MDGCDRGGSLHVSSWETSRWLLLTDVHRVSRRCWVVSEVADAACRGHSSWLRMSVRDGAATMATITSGGGGGGGGKAANPQDGRSYLLQIYPRLSTESSACCYLRLVRCHSKPPSIINCLFVFDRVINRSNRALSRLSVRDDGSCVAHGAWLFVCFF